MILLAFETATPTGGTALYRNGVLEGEMVIANAQHHSGVCLRFAEDLLHHHGLAWKDVTAVACSRGPGSFTGVRVALTLVKSLAWSLHLKAVTVSTLEAIAWQADAPEGALVVPLIDARIGEVYGAVFRREGAVYTRVQEDFCTPPDALAARLAPLGGPLVFVGEGAIRYAGAVEPLGTFARADRMRLLPATTGLLALRDLAAGRSETAEEIAAVYLRDAVPAKRP